MERLKGKGVGGRRAAGTGGGQWRAAITRNQRAQQNTGNGQESKCNQQSGSSSLYFCLFQFFKKYLFGCTSLSWDTGDLPSSLWHAGFFFLTVACNSFLVVSCGIQFPDQGSNLPPCVGSAESQPLDHQGIPPGFYLKGIRYCFEPRFFHSAQYISKSSVLLQYQYFFPFNC